MSQPEQKLYKMLCQAWGAEFIFSASVAGRRARCLSCKHIFRVPELSDNASPAHPVANVPEHNKPPVKERSVPAAPPASAAPAQPAAAKPPDRTSAPKAPAPRAPKPPSKKRSHSVRMNPQQKTPPPQALLGNDELLGVDAPVEPSPAPTAADDPLENLASLERRTVQDSEPAPFADPAEEAAAAPAKRQSGPVLVLEGLMYLALIVLAIFLAFRFLGLVVGVWVLVPIIVVFGRRLFSRVTFLMTMGLVRVP